MTSVVAYVATLDQWSEFEDQWGAGLAHCGIERFRYSDVCNRSDGFEIISWMKDIVKKSHVHAFGSCMIDNHWEAWDGRPISLLLNLSHFFGKDDDKYDYEMSIDKMDNVYQQGLLSVLLMMGHFIEVLCDNRDWDVVSCRDGTSEDLLSVSDKISQLHSNFQNVTYWNRASNLAGLQAADLGAACFREEWLSDLMNRDDGGAFATVSCDTIPSGGALWQSFFRSLGGVSDGKKAEISPLLWMSWANSEWKLPPSF